MFESVKVIYLLKGSLALFPAQSQKIKKIYSKKFIIFSPKKVYFISGNETFRDRKIKVPYIFSKKNSYFSGNETFWP